MMEQLWLLAGTIVTSVFTSTGLWSFLQKRSEKKNSSSTLIMGLAHMEIVKVGLRFIQRGWVSRAEYHDYLTYLVEPYEGMGGNGTADKIFKEVQKLPIKDAPPENWTDSIPVIREDA